MKRRALYYPGAIKRPGKNSGTMQGKGHRVMTLHDPGGRAGFWGVDSTILAKNGEYTAVLDDSGSKPKFYQYYPFNRGARSMANAGIAGGVGNNKAGAVNIQICIIVKGYKYGHEDPIKYLSDAAIKIILEICEAWGIPLLFRGVKMSESEWLKFNGITCHKNVPGNWSDDAGTVPKNFFINKKAKLIGKKKVVKPVADKREWTVVTVNRKTKAAKKVHKALGKFNTMGVGRSKLTRSESRKAADWARKKAKYQHVYRNRKKYPFLVVDSDTKLPKPKLSAKLNRLGQRRRRFVFVGEGWRTHARQWELWRAYQNGSGNLAAYPGTSNHEYGNAADCSIFNYGKDGVRINVGADSKCRSLMHKMGMCLPVGGENWHVQLGNTWRA